MAAFEGGLIAALTMAFGIAPGRRFVPRSVEYKPLALARIEPVLDVCPDVTDAKPDKSIDTSVRPVEAPTRLASTRAFVKWWRTLDDEPAEITRHRLCALYGEYCDYAHVIPLSDRTLVNKIKQHGVETVRAPQSVKGGKLHKPTLYRLRRRT